MFQHSTSRLRLTGRVLWLVLLFSAPALPAQESSTGANDDQGITVLESGKPIECEIAGGQQHRYRIALSEGQYIRVEIRPQGIGIGVSLQKPGRNPQPFIDPPGMTQEPIIQLVAETSGVYRLGVYTTRSASPGRYEIRIVELRPATETDREVESARRLSDESIELQRGGKYSEAIPIAERALAIWEKALGSEHLDVAMSLYDLANLYREMSDYVRAEPLYQRALAIREKALGAEHILVATSLNDLANLYREKGDYVQSESLHQRALAIREKALGPEHPNVAASLHNLAALYRAKGDSVRAEPLYQRALAIKEKALGPEHLDVATSLNNLANLYREKGDYVQAESLHKRALAIWEKALGPEHPDIAMSLNNLGLMYFKMGDSERAEPLYQRALAIREKALGVEHPLFATSLNNIANLYREKGDYVGAEPLHLRALAIWEKALGPEHRIVASSLNDVANLYREKGDYERAEPLYLRALVIREKALGPEHPAVALLLNDLAVLYRAKGDATQAVRLLTRANDIREHNLALILTTGSEDQKRLYLSTFSDEADATLSLHVCSAPDDPQAASLALTTILRRKGRVLDAMSDQIGALRRHLAPEDRALLDQFSAARAQLASLVLGESGKTPPAQRQAAIATLSTEIERLEAAISRRSTEFRAQTRAVTLEALQQALPPDAALVEIVSYRPFNPKATRRDERFGAPHYVAYVLKREGAPSWVELGDRASIDAAVARLRAALDNPKSREVKQLARAVDERVMRPVRALLGDATHLLVSPDGELNLIPLEALVDEHEQGRYLIERYSFTYLTSGRDLLRLNTERESKSNAFVLADPLFGEPEIAQVGKADRRVSPGGRRQSVTTGNDLSSVYFSPLEGTAEEARAIKSLFPEASVVTGQQATESALKLADAPRLLHIATHGFFLTDKLPTVETRGRRAISATAKVENPLLRSGLALAGANLPRKDGQDDGILTALEASGLNLWGTKLVTLSACDTGVGEVKNGEGVYGLRRAFVLAGAETLVMSLWPVSDYVTREMMTAYYKGLKQGLERGEALRQMQLSMLKRKGREHPFYWASFIQSGEWATLNGKR